MGFDLCILGKNWVVFSATLCRALRQTTDGPLSYAGAGRCEHEYRTKARLPSLLLEIATTRLLITFHLVG